jgi:hypothetical protein
MGIAAETKLKYLRIARTDVAAEHIKKTGSMFLRM